MKALGILAAALFAPGIAWGACPTQPSTVDLRGGTGRLCVISTPTAPVTGVTLKLVSATGSATVPIDAAPAGQTIADGTVYTVTVPASLRGDGTAELQATGPGGASEVARPVVRFRDFDAATAPVLTQ